MHLVEEGQHRARLAMVRRRPQHDLHAALTIVMRSLKQDGRFPGIHRRIGKIEF